MNKKIMMSLCCLVVVGATLWFILKDNSIVQPTPIQDQPVNSSPIATVNEKEFKIDAYRYYFSPNVITVKQGDKVKITINNIDDLHGISIPDLELNNNEVLEFVADKAGEFIWYCNNYCGEGHSRMQGRLIVQ